MDERISEALQDVLGQALDIREFTLGLTFENYQQDRKTQAAVERKFEIIGEALNRIFKKDPEMLESIRDYRNIISFRNILAHGYDSVDDRLVWGIIENNLNHLIEDVQRVIAG